MPSLPSVQSVQCLVQFSPPRHTCSPPPRKRLLAPASSPLVFVVVVVVMEPLACGHYGDASALVSAPCAVPVSERASERAWSGNNKETSIMASRGDGGGGSPRSHAAGSKRSCRQVRGEASIQALGPPKICIYIVLESDRVGGGGENSRHSHRKRSIKSFA